MAFNRLCPIPLLCGYSSPVSRRRLGRAWVEHPKSPIIGGKSTYRQTGRKSCIFGPQDYSLHPGLLPRVWQAQCSGLRNNGTNITTYREQAVDLPPIIEAGGNGWNESGMHHIDPHLRTMGNGSHVWMDGIGKSRAENLALPRQSGRAICGTTSSLGLTGALKTIRSECWPGI